MFTVEESLEDTRQMLYRVRVAQWPRIVTYAATKQQALAYIADLLKEVLSDGIATGYLIPEPGVS